MKRLLTILLGLAAYIGIVRPWYLHWGTMRNEHRDPLPGDDIAPGPQSQSTRAITIDAPREAVWPWLMQMGQEKGGFYSYEMLENLAGCRIKNADAIVPEYQTIQVGDKIRLGPEGYPYFLVAEIEPEHRLILQAANPKTGEPDTAVWSFHLKDWGKDTSRLIVRNRLQYEPNPVNFITWTVVTEPVTFIMEQKMLRGIKSRAEKAWPQKTPAQP